MEKPQPILIFVTSSGCDHCRTFRGIDGKPSDEKQWCSSLIREYLTGTRGSCIGRKLLCSKIIEIHDYTLGPSIDNIEEFNIYAMIPPDIRIDDDFINEILADDNQIIGDSILRISIRRKLDDRIIVEIEIDGDGEDRRCEYIKELVENFFIWDRVAIEFSNLRKYFRDNTSITFEECCTDSLKRDPIYQTILKKHNTYCDDYIEFDNDLRGRFTYGWFISKNYPTRLREIEAFYPSWILVLPSEWKNGLDGKSKVYGKVKNVTTTLQGTRYISRPIKQERVQDIITQYYAGRLSLTYSDSLTDQSRNSEVQSQKSGILNISLDSNVRRKDVVKKVKFME